MARVRLLLSPNDDETVSVNIQIVDDETPTGTIESLITRLKNTSCVIM